jgi:ATP-dependent Lhr-like helicase
MADPPVNDARSLREALKRTWGPFFARFPALTDIQLAVIPRVLAGANVSVHSPTASGKTEAVLAPVLERMLAEGGPGERRAVLYLTPTRALGNDLLRRLEGPLHDLRVEGRIRTGDRRGIRTDQALPDLLVTTPESFDSLLARNPAAFLKLGAVIVDELHLLDGTPRGDQLRVLLVRLRRILRDRPPALHVLTATLKDPRAVSERYWPDLEPVVVPGQRPIQAESVEWSREHGPRALAEHLRQQHLVKLLAFANSRQEAEDFAAAMRRAWSYGEQVFVHYSNLDRASRAAIEEAFATGAVGLAVATTTLELGIDVGDVEAVILFGPPLSVTSYLQRIGRGDRRSDVTRVIRLPRTPQEAVLFDLLHRRAVFGSLEPRPPWPLDPAVVAQQVASILYQRRHLETRPEHLDAILAAVEVDPVEVRAVLAEMTRQGFLGEGRPGALLITDKLERLIGRGEIHSTIGADEHSVEVVDVETGRTVGWLDEEADHFALAGRTWKRVRRAGHRLLARAEGAAQGARVPGGSGRLPTSLLLARDLKVHLYGVGADQVPLAWDRLAGVLTAVHHLGPAWGEVLAAALARRVQLGRVLLARSDRLVVECGASPEGLDGEPLFPGGPEAALSDALITTLARRQALGRHAFLVPREVREAHLVRCLRVEFATWELGGLRFRLVPPESV